MNQRSEAPTTEGSVPAKALRDLMRAYVVTLENARDRIIFLGGDCDTLDKMEAGDPALNAAKRVLAAGSSGGASGIRSADEPRDVLLDMTLRQYAQATRRDACGAWSDVVIPPYAGLDDAKCQLAAAIEDRLKKVIDELADLSRQSPEPCGDPWVKTSVRVPTDDECRREDDQIIGAYVDPDGVWDMTGINELPMLWKSSWMKAPDYWTFASKIAPGRSVSPEPPGAVVAAMLDYNQMLRSFAMIASRNGEQTRWEGLYDQIHALLAKHHETWKRYFPPMQPDDEGSIYHQCLVPVQPPTKGENNGT